MGQVRLAILAGKRGFSAMIVLLVLIKKIDWTLALPAISLTRWSSATCLWPVVAAGSGASPLPGRRVRLRQSLIMKLVGFLLMLAGWFLVLAALEMLGAATPRALFVLAGFAVEVLGLALVFRANLAEPEVEP